VSENQPVSVGWLDHQAKLCHVEAFLNGLRYRQWAIKAERSRRNWLGFLIFPRLQREIIKSHEQVAHKCLEGVMLFAMHAQAYEDMANDILACGGTR